MKFKPAFSFLLIFILLLPQIFFAQNQNSIQWGLHPSIGLTYTNLSQVASENENLEWLLCIRANLNYPGENFQFDSDLLDR